MLAYPQYIGRNVLLDHGVGSVWCQLARLAHNSSTKGEHLAIWTWHKGGIGTFWMFQVIQTLVWMSFLNKFSSLTCSYIMPNKKWSLTIVTNFCLKLKKLKNFKFQENENHKDINHGENINKTRILSKLKKNIWNGEG